MESREKKRVKISILMGAYNIDKPEYLDLAVDSIIRQDFKDWELIICDDGSDDKYKACLERQVKKDKRICLIRFKENRGLAAALNACLKKSVGQYIARMDADDISMPERLGIELDFLEKNREYDLVASNCRLFDENGRWGLRNMPEKPVKEDFLFRNPFNHPTIMMTRKSLVAIRGYRSIKITRRAEDYDMYMRFYAAGFKGYNIQKYLLDFREDKDAFKRKKYSYRIDEARVRYRGFKSLGMMPGAMIYVIKPLLVGLIPVRLLKRLKKIFIKSD